MQIVWRFDVAMTMVATIGRIIAAWILWSVIFTDQEVVSGFTFQSMLSYYVVSSFLASLDMSNQISGEMSYLIKDGGFSKHMVTPMNPFGFFSHMIAGEAVFHLGFSLIAAAFCAIVFQISIVLSPDIVRIILGCVLTVTGLLFMAGYQYVIGVLAFKFIDISFFLHVQGSIIAFATGALVPLSLLPSTVVLILQYLPFTHVVYTPAMVFTGQISISEGLYGLCILLLWTVVIISLGQLAYTKLRTRYEGVGI